MSEVRRCIHDRTERQACAKCSAMGVELPRGPAMSTEAGKRLLEEILNAADDRTTGGEPWSPLIAAIEAEAVAPKASR